MVTGCARFLALCALLSLPPLTGAIADPTIKPALTGLISTGSPDNMISVFSGTNTINGTKVTYDLTGIFGGLVVQVLWSQLQPTSSSDFYTSVIDDALNAVTTYNGTVGKTAPNNRQIGVRLRVFSGCYAPTWAQSLGGSPIQTSASYNGGTSCVLGRFWAAPTTGSYAQAWAQLQTRLAAKYDNISLIQEVAVTSCTSYSAEPFYLPNDQTVAQPLLKAGYSDPAYQQCLENAVTDYAPWQTTRLEFTFNPFSGLMAPANQISDIAFSERVMRACRQVAGQRCILSNHDLDTNPPNAGAILPLYAVERKLGPNITFQTYVKTPTDFEGTLRKGISMGAGAIEVWPDGYEVQTNATLTNWASMFVPK